MKMSSILFTLLLLDSAGKTQDSLLKVNIVDPGPKTILTGELGQPLGSILTVCGVIVDGPDKGYEGGPNLVVHMINDSATQVPIQIPVSPYFGKFGDYRLPIIKNGNTYRLRVFETGEYVGSPAGDFKETGVAIQTTGFYFMNRLVVLSGEKTAALFWHPAQFTGRYALLAGTAANENDTAVIRSTTWKLKLLNCPKWTETAIGKRVEVYGKIKETPAKDIFYVENGQPRLIRLEDQLGKPVTLRGLAISSNGNWWFNYRGTDVYIEKMDQLPGWNGENHFKAMEITGILDQERLPRLDQISLKENRDLKMYYIVRNAGWTPVNQLLEPELGDFR